jgi:phage tail protein X
MAPRNYYSWTSRDSLWAVAGRMLALTGYSNTITLAEAIRAANPQILDWAALAPGTLVYLPAILTGY